MKYSNHGEAYRLIDLQKGQRVAWKQFEGFEGDDLDGELCLVTEEHLHDCAPIAKLDLEVEARRETLAGLNEEIRELRREKCVAEEATKERLTLLKQHKGLERLEDFITGKLTHCVTVCSWKPPEIGSFADSADDRDGIRLLALFGASNGDLQWRLNAYKDNSGCWTDIFPYTSEEEAVKKATSIFEEHQRDVLDPDSRVNPNSDWIEKAKELGVPVSDEHKAAVNKYRRNCVARAITKQEVALAELRKEAEVLAPGESLTIGPEEE